MFILKSPMDLPSKNGSANPTTNPTLKKIDPKVLIGILTVIIATVIVGGSFALKQSADLKSPSSPSPKSANPQSTQPSTNSRGTSTPAQGSSGQSPSEQFGFKFTTGIIVGFNANTNILTISTKDKPNWQIPIDSSVKLYKDTGKTDTALVQMNELTKGLAASIQQDAKTGKVIQITIAGK